MRESLEAGRADGAPTVLLADEICDYFGVKIAMYFAWLGFYTSAMVYPAVFGSVLYTFTEADQVLEVGWAGAGVPETPSSLANLANSSAFRHPQTSRDVSCVVFALFNVVWSTLFLEEWKRRGAELAYKWGTLDSPGEAVEEPRPQFRVSRGCLSPRTPRMRGGGGGHCRGKDKV